MFNRNDCEMGNIVHNSKTRSFNRTLLGPLAQGVYSKPTRVSLHKITGIKQTDDKTKGSSTFS